MTGYLEILGAVSLWAVFNGLLIKGIKTSGVGVGTWTGFSGLLIFLATFFFFGMDPLAVVTKGQILPLILLGVFAALNNSFNYTAVKISLPVALLFHYLAPLLIIVWGLLFPVFEQIVTPPSVVALIMALIGLVYMTIPNIKEGNKKLILLGSLSAIFYSLEIVFSGYLSNQLQVPAAASSFAKLFFQMITMPIVGWLFLKESVKVSGNKEWLKIALGGAILYASFILYFNGSATVNDLHRGILGYIDRIGAIALGAYFFKEERNKITRNTWIGGSLILGAGLIVIFF